MRRTGIAKLCALTALGLALTLLRVSGIRVAAAAVRVYISYVRGTPLLVQILLVYYLLPSIGIALPVMGLLVVGLVVLDRLASGHRGLGLHD